MAEVILHFTILFCLLLAASSYLRKGKQSARARFFGMTMLCFGLESLGPVAGRTDSFFSEFKDYLFFHTSLLFALAPVSFFYFRTFTQSGHWSNRDLIHFIPFGVAFLVHAFWIENTKVYFWVAGIGDVWLVLYFGASVLILNRSGMGTSLPGVFATAYLTSALALTIVFFTWQPGQFYVGLSFPIILMAQFFIGQKYPELLGGEIKPVKASRTLLGGIDTVELDKKLNTVLKNEKLYLDDDLSLPKLAGIVGVTVHQLSEFLNKHKEQNFRRYINHFRIEAAKQMLLDEPRASVLSIAYAVGFNSKSSFNEQFARITGHSPAKYRRYHRPSSSG